MRRLIGIGWVFFAFSGVLYLIAGIRAGDALAAWGSVLWLIGVGMFLAVFVYERPRKR